MTPAQQQLLKHAQNEIIAVCGGLDEVSTITSYGRSTVGRWSDVGNPTLMPIAAVVALEAHCQVPVMTAALAAIANRRIADQTEQDTGQKPVMTVFAEAFIASGQLTGTFADAIADGKLTPNELSELDRVTAALERKVSMARKSLAAARADGGLKVVG
jgi:hypothetical protein